MGISKISVVGAGTMGNGIAQTLAVAGRDVVENNRWAVAPSLALGLGRPTRLTLSFLHMTQDNVPEYGIPWVTANNTNSVLIPYRNAAPPVSFDNFYGLKNYDFEDVDNDVVTALSNYLKRLVTAVGFEPTTNGLKVRCSTD